VFSIFDDVESFQYSTVLLLWVSFKRLEITGVSLPYSLDIMVETALRVEDSKFIRAGLEAFIFGACLRADRLDLLDELFTKAKYVKRDTLSTTRRISLLRHHVQKGETADYEKIRSEFWAAETPFNRLKINDVDNIFGTSHANVDHRQIEFAFETSANPSLAAEYGMMVKPVYDRLRPNLAFMDVRSNQKERTRFQSLVIEAVKQQKPFSMVRLSDGEGHAFGGVNGLFTLEDQINRERHWWGIELDSSTRAEVISRVQNATQSADILGIPSVHRFVSV